MYNPNICFLCIFLIFIFTKKGIALSQLLYFILFEDPLERLSIQRRHFKITLASHLPVQVKN